MSYTYADYITLTDQRARLTRMALHIEEVSQKLTREVQADGNSVASQSLQQYLDTLFTRFDKLESTIGAVDSSVTTRVTQIRINRP